MQKIKTVQIGKRSFTVKELPIRTIWGLLNNEQDAAEVSILDRGQGLLKLACPELDIEALLDMYPSEIEELWQAFEEVNSSFLGKVRMVGMDQILLNAVRDSIRQFACSSNPVTVQ